VARSVFVKRADWEEKRTVDDSVLILIMKLEG
jgi:hypothetical protein